MQCNNFYVLHTRKNFTEKKTLFWFISLSDSCESIKIHDESRSASEWRNRIHNSRLAFNEIYSARCAVLKYLLMTFSWIIFTFFTLQCCLMLYGDFPTLIMQLWALLIKSNKKFRTPENHSCNTESLDVEEEKNQTCRLIFSSYICVNGDFSMIFKATFSAFHNEFPLRIPSAGSRTVIYIEMKRIQMPICIINDTFWQMENWIFLHVTPINFFLHRTNVDFLARFFALFPHSPHNRREILRNFTEIINFKAWKTMKNCFWGWIERPENVMWKCDTSFGVVKIVMATENCENFPCRSLWKWRKSSGVWRKIERRLRIADLAMCFSMWWQRKFDFPCSSKHFRVHESCDVARFSRLDHVVQRFLFAFSVSRCGADSRDFPPIRVEFDKRGFSEGACDILEQDTPKHVFFSETEIGNWAWAKAKNPLKNDFRWGFSLNFPVFRVVGVSWEMAGRSRKTHVEPPKAMCFP